LAGYRALSPLMGHLDASFGVVGPRGLRWPFGRVLTVAETPPPVQSFRRSPLAPAAKWHRTRAGPPVIGLHRALAPRSRPLVASRAAGKGISGQWSTTSCANPRCTPPVRDMTADECVTCAQSGTRPGVTQLALHAAAVSGLPWPRSLPPYCRRKTLSGKNTIPFKGQRLARQLPCGANRPICARAHTARAQLIYFGFHLGFYWSTAAGAILDVTVRRGCPCGFIAVHV